MDLALTTAAAASDLPHFNGRVGVAGNSGRWGEVFDPGADTAWARVALGVNKGAEVLLDGQEHAHSITLSCSSRAACRPQESDDRDLFIMPAQCAGAPGS